MPATTRSWLCCLSDFDRDCIRFIAEQNVMSIRSDAVRLAITRQVARIEADPDAYADLAERCSRASRDRVIGRRSPRWQQMYRPEDFLALDRIQAALGLAKRVAALRVAIRAQAHADGLAVPGLSV